MDPGGLHALAAALDVQSGARREQRNYAQARAPARQRRPERGRLQRPPQDRPHRPPARLAPARAPAPARPGHRRPARRRRQHRQPRHRPDRQAPGQRRHPAPPAPPPDPLPRTPPSCWTTPPPPGSPSPSRATARACRNTSGHKARTYDTPEVNNRRGPFATNWPRSCRPLSGWREQGAGLAWRVY